MKINLSNQLMSKRTMMVCALMVFVYTMMAQTSRSYNTESLSSNLITGICQDQRGYLWIGTEYGLNKFDGVHFTQYYHDETDTRSLHSDHVRRQLIDKSGALWIVTPGGVQRYNPVRNDFEAVDFGDSPVDITDILQIPSGKFWLLNSQHGVFELDPATMKAQPVSPICKALGDQSFGAMYLDAKQRLWLISSNVGIVEFDTKSKQTHTYGEAELGTKNITGLFEKDGHLFVVSRKAVSLLNEQSLQFESVIPIPPTIMVRRVYQNSDHRFIVGSYGQGAYMIDFEHRQLQPLFPQYASQKVYAYFEDYSHNVWLGCFQEGLYYLSLRAQPFNYLSLSKTAFNNNGLLTTAYSDSQGRLFIGQERNGIVETSSTGGTGQRWLDGHTVISVYDDHQGHLWVGTYAEGAFRITPATREVLPIHGLEGCRVKRITADHQGNIYMAILNGTLRSFTSDGLKERTLCKGKLELRNRYLNTLMTDSEGLIWIGHYQGVDVYDPKGDRLIDLPLDTLMQPATTYAIAEAEKGIIFFGTNRGLFSYHKKTHKWKRYTVKDGLPNDIVCGIVVSKNGIIWLSTYRGLSCMDTQKETFVNYYRGNGLEDFCYQRGIYGGSSYGMVYFGNDHGLTWFSPDNITRQEFLHGLTLTGILLNNQQMNATMLSGGHQISDLPLEDTKDITLSYVDNTFTLQFSSMDFREPQNVYYEYRFTDDPSDLWHRTPTGDSEITITHLGYGKNVLQVRACDNGVYSPIKTLTIRITPPWYRSWWVYCLYVLVLFGITALLLLYYKHRQEAQTNEEKIRFFVDISHELRSPLTLIKSPLDSLLKKDFDVTTQRALRNMQRNTERLLLLVNQILSLRKIERGQTSLHYTPTVMAPFIRDLCHTFDLETERRHIDLQLHSTDEGLEAWIDREHFDKVVVNLIGNAMKYVKDGGHIDVCLSSKDSHFLFSVKDNGPGIDEEYLKKVFDRFFQTSVRPSGGQMGYGIGLNLSYQLVKMHGGTIVAHRRTDGPGSEFLVTIPMGNTHLPKDSISNERYVSPQTKETEPVAVITEEAKTRRTRRKTNFNIIVADDNQDIREFLLTELGESYHISAYPDGKQALEAIADEVPDLVISDVIMPEMDGFTLLHRIKNSTKTSHIPVILLTSKTEHQSRLEGLEEGADAYIDKPFNMEELEARIAGLIANRNRMKGKFSGVQEQDGIVRQIELKGNNEQLMEKIMEVVNARLTEENFNVEALADAVGLSRVQLHRRVKELTGITVGEFIRNLRMQQAAKLLEKGDVTIAQVTYAIGMANPTHFTAAFKKYFGITPTEYMNKHTHDTKA